MNLKPREVKSRVKTTKKWRGHNECIDESNVCANSKQAEIVCLFVC